MIEQLINIQLGNKMANLLDRPVLIGHEVDKSGRIIHYILGVSDSSKYPGKKIELTLTRGQYFLFLLQRLNTRRLVKTIGAILLLYGLIFGNGMFFYVGGGLTLLCDVIWLSGGNLRSSWLDYAIAYVLGLLIFGWQRGIFVGSAALILYILSIDPYFFFERNPGSGLNIDKIKCQKRMVNNKLQLEEKREFKVNVILEEIKAFVFFVIFYGACIGLLAYFALSKFDDGSGTSQNIKSAIYAGLVVAPIVYIFVQISEHFSDKSNKK